MLILSTFIALSLAMWTNVLKLNTLISTGEIDLDYRNVYLEEFNEDDNKDVGTCSYVIESSNGIDYLKMFISNGYPGYGCRVSFEIVNTGSIPVIGPFYNVTETPQGVEVIFNPPDILQLHPGDSANYEISVIVLQEAGENSTYFIDIAITYVQWNEAHSSISGYVWNDVDNNGLWDPGEEPVEGVLILLERGGVMIAYRYTDQDGYYYFLVQPGTYTIKIIIPPGYTNTTPITIVSTLEAGQSSVNNNFGIVFIITSSLTVFGEFRHTDKNLNECPVFLGTLLEKINVTVPSSGEYMGRVISVSPGAYYHILWINGSGLRNVSITYTYDYQFDIENGFSGKIRAYVLNTTTMCIIRQLSMVEFNYSVNNTSNEASMSINLPNQLSWDSAILIYSKFKPTHYHIIYEPYGLRYNYWDHLDKYFEITWEVISNIGSASGTNIIGIFKK